MGLPELSDAIRNNLKWFILVILSIIFLWIVWGIISSITRSVFETRKEKVAFGKLASPVFTKTLTKFTSKKYVSEVDGLPEASSQQESLEAPVFKTLGATAPTADQERSLVGFFGVSASPREQDNLKIWENPNFGQKLTLNKTTNHYTFKLDVAKSPSVVSGKVSKEEETVITNLKNRLRVTKMLPPDLEEGKTTVRYYSIKKSKALVNRSLANSLEVTFYRKLGSLFTTGDPPIKALFGYDGERLIDYSFSYTIIDPIGSLYPVITKLQALQQFQTGQAFSKTASAFDTVTAREINLSYWESSFYQPYLQPVWIVSGRAKKGGVEDDFEAYIPAVSPEQLEGATSSPPALVVP